MKNEQPQDLKPGVRQRLGDSRSAAHIVPLAIFLLFVQLALVLRVPNSKSPWWDSAPALWVYPIQTILCLGLLWFWRKHYRILPLRGGLLAIVAGIAGAAIWIAPVACHAATGLGGDAHWLGWLGFRERLDGFNPTLFDRRSDPVAFGLTIAFRFLRLVIVVPLVEEIFWRGFLMRWLIDSGKPWHRIPIGTFSWKSFLITTALFTLVHQPADYAVAVVYGALVGWLTVHTKSLAAAILMHAVTNLILGLYVMKTGFWGLW